MKRFIIFFLIISIILLIMPNTSCLALTSDKRAIIFIVDNINYDDLLKYGQGNIRFLLQNGAVGLMNTNTGGSYTSANAYATIGAGTRAVCSSYGNYAGGYRDLFGDQQINEVYQRNTGKKMDQENIANFDIYGLIKQNDRLNPPAKIGILGSLLNKNGYKTAVLGNEGTNMDNIRVNASLISMNDKGITDYGKVDKSALIHDYMSPFGIKTNYDALFDYYNSIKDEASFIVIQTGDTVRLYKYMDILEERHEEMKREIFQEIDSFLGKIIQDIDKDTLFMLVVPFPSSDDLAEGKKLTPLVVYSNSIDKGVLTSATTKRAGIVANTDLAAHILSHFEIEKPSVIVGHKLTSKSVSNPLEYLLRLNHISVFNNKIRPSVIKTFIGCIIAVLVVTFIFMLYLKRYLEIIKPLLIAILMTPTILLILPIVNPWNPERLIFSLVAGVLFTSLAIYFTLKDNLQILIFSSFISVAVILIDTLLNNTLMKVSILGYDPIIGARFYGIGNEYMGFLIGSTIIGTSALIDKYRKKGSIPKFVSIAVYIIVLYVLMSPNLGTNVGGSIAAFIGFSTAAILFFKGRITKKAVLLTGGFLIITLFLLFIYDSMRPAQLQSHIGQTANLIKRGSVTSLFQIFARKLAMNYKLVKYSTWTWALFATIAALGILFRWPVGILKGIFGKHNYLYFGFISGIVGTLAAFCFNDSGVVAAAMFMIPITIPLLLMCIDEEKNNM